MKRPMKSLLAAAASTSLFAAFAVAGVTVASAQDDSLSQGGPSTTCVTTNPDGSPRAPHPGDCAQFGKAGQGRSDAKAKNVILLIGDGMGQQEITLARNYLHGAGGRFEGIDNFVATGAYTHHSVNKDGSINYVTDSAASATGWSTGTKTYNGAIGVDIEGKPVENLMEMAKKAGMRTGNVTTSEIQDATPAAAATHSVNRKCYGPDESQNGEGCKGEAFDPQFREHGGLGSISEQIVDFRADVTLGGGAKSFGQKVKESGPGRNPFVDNTMQWEAGKTVLENAKEAGFTIVRTAKELDAVKEANQDAPVLGLFNNGNMTTRFADLRPSEHGSQEAPHECTTQDTGEEPELKDMAAKAIELLDDPSSDKGFYLQVESASIDKRNHSADLCGVIGETDRLDETVKAALDFAKQDGNTLVLLSADHAHSAQILYDATDSVSATSRVKTADGVGMTVGWGTLPMDTILNDPKMSTQHTGSQLRIAAYGPGAENVIGQTDQTDTFFTMANALKLGDWEPAKANNKNQVDVAKARPAVNARDNCYLVTQDSSKAGNCAQFGAEGEGLDDSKAKNVVFMIADGTGDSEITSARDYLVGASGRLPGVDNMAFTGSATTYPLEAKTGLPGLVTDSAASATAWNAGVKTYNGAIGVDLAGNPVPLLSELARKKGMKVGNVTTAEIEDATPAAFATHALNRKCYGPEADKNKSSCQGEDMSSQYRENGGLGSISEQLVDFRADVTLGGGSKAFDQVVQKGGTWGGQKWEEGKTVLENAKDQGYQVVTTGDELDAVTSANTDKPVLGLFSEGNFPRHNEQSIPELDGAVAPAVDCVANPERPSTIPELADLTTKSLDLLKNDNGFLLQVEGASVDKAGHDADFCGQVGEFDEFDKAVQAVREWVKKTGEPTLIITTADHAHTSQITAPGKNTSGRTIKVHGQEGSDMVINYATAPSNDEKVALGGQTHTGTQMRVSAEGPGAANVLGQLDQTDIAFVAANALGLDLVGAPETIDLTPQWDKDARFGKTSAGTSSWMHWGLGLAGLAILVAIGYVAYRSTKRDSGVIADEPHALAES